jgi:hypothetical protein
MGFWREEFNRHVRFDPTIQHAGIDATMRILHRYRIVWCDMRFCFVPGPHMVSPGGLAGSAPPTASRSMTSGCAGATARPSASTTRPAARALAA